MSSSEKKWTKQKSKKGARKGSGIKGVD